MQKEAAEYGANATILVVPEETKLVVRHIHRRQVFMQ